MFEKKFFKYLLIFSAIILIAVFSYVAWVNYSYNKISHQVLKTKVDEKSLPADLLEKYINKARVLEYAAEESLKKPIAKKTEEELNNGFKVWWQLGMVRKMLNDYSGAAEAWEQASKIAPENSAPVANLADLYTYFLKDYVKAEEMYLKTVNLFPSVDNYRNFADFYRISAPGNSQKVEEVILQGLIMYPDHQDLLAYLGSFFKEIGNKEKAIFYLEKLIAKYPDHPAKADLEKLKNN